MNAFKSIRKSLGLTQAAMAEVLGCTQGNVSFYENGQTVPPDVARKLIDFAKSSGQRLTYDDFYARRDDYPAPTPQPEEPAKEAS